MATELQTNIINALDDIEARLAANPNDPAKADLLANANTLVVLLRQVDEIALSDAADAVTAAAGRLQQVINQAGNGPLDMTALNSASTDLRRAATTAVTPATPVNAPASPKPAAPTPAPPSIGTTPTAATRQGLDCALDCTGRAAAIAAAGKNFVVRYYRSSGSSFSPLTANEARALSAAGLDIVSIWESASDNVAHFSHTTGLDEGTSAYKQAMLVGQPAGTPIYFAVDFDCSDKEVAGPINDYFQAIASAFSAMGHGNSAYSVGVYGSGRACTWLTAQGLADFTWLAMSTGWNGFASYSGWNIKQGPHDGALAFDYDTDVANGPFGGFRV
jgi:hypothetical protein